MLSRREDGLPARLLLFLPFLLSAAAAPPAAALEDFYSAALGLDYPRDIGVLPGKPFPALPGGVEVPDPSGGPGPVSGPAGASAGLAYGNLARRDGDPAFAHGGLSTAIETRLLPLPGLALLAGAEQASLDRRIGDSSLALDQGFRPREIRGAAAFPVFPGLVPRVSAAWRSGNGGRHAWVGAALAGRAGTDRAGASFDLSTGRRSLDFPLALDLPDYRPMGVPFLLRQDDHALALEARSGALELSWSGRLRQARRPGHQEAAYALSDSGSLEEQSLGAALRGAGPGGPWRAEARLESGSGRHHFKGRSQDRQGRYQFGYLEALQRSLDLRGGFAADLGAWRAAGRAGASALEWNAERPRGSASGRLFWDRNAVLDSYEGSLLGIFNRETWLLDADARLLKIEAGLAAERRPAGPSRAGRWGARLAMDWQRLDLQARGHLTKRTDVGILARTQEEVEREFPGLVAHLLLPELSLSLDLLRGVSLRGAVSQALPVHVEIGSGNGGRGGGGDGGTGRNGRESARFTGGTAARLFLVTGWP